MFPASFFEGNRQSLRNKLAGKPALLAGHGLVQRKADTTFTFSQDSNIWYLSGINEPDCTVVIGTKASDDALIFPRRSAIREAFDGSVDANEAKRTSGISRILDEKAGWEHIGKLLEKSSLQAATLPPLKGYIEHGGFYTNPGRKRLAASLKRRYPKVVLTDCRPVLAALRSRKQPSELLALQKAIDISCDAFELVRSGIAEQKYSFEYEIDAEITSHFLNQGGYGHAYQPIIANGKHATTLHYMTNKGIVDRHQFTVIDAGAEVSGYAADVTRTFIGSKPSQRQLDVYNAVLRVQNVALSYIKPGTHMRELEDAVRGSMAVELVKLGLIKGVDDIDAVNYYYPHATSHFLGLDVHDVGNYNESLAENMVITCEPGIYIPEEGIGVRIEDDILITTTGYSNLSERCAKDIASLY